MVASHHDGWPKGLFSVVPASRRADHMSPYGFALYCHGSSFGLIQGAESIDLRLIVDNEPGKPQTVAIVRPARSGDWARGYRNGDLKAQAFVRHTEQGRRQDTGYLLAAHWPLGNFGACDLYEILAYDRVLSDAELQSLHQYLLAPRAN